MGEMLDPLYVIFERFLHSGEFDRLPEAEIIDAIVAEYMLFLVKQGAVPHTKMDEIKQDLTLEVRDMLKMKTYGHFNLRHYNSSRKKSG